MKNGLLIWNIALTLLAGYLLIAHLSTKKRTGKITETTSRDTSSVSPKFRIAYFEMDSVAANFEEAKQFKAELLKREDDNNNELNRLAQEFRDKYTYYQDKAKMGQLTEPQSLAANEEMKKMKDNLDKRKADLEQDYSEFMVRRQNDIKGKIESFIKSYNKEKNYSYVVSDDPGLFYYQDTTYNITSDLIKGLNKLHPLKKNK